MPYLLDTDICIFYLKDKFRIIDKIKSVGISNCYISEITIAELKFGAAKSNNYVKHSSEVAKIEELFIAMPIYSNLDRYASVKARLQRDGVLIPDFDLLIGVTAVENDLTMVTNNEKHMRSIEDIQLENWIKKEFNEHI